LEEKFTKVKDKRWLKRYLRFIETFSLESEIIKETHNHHILPSSLYPEYADLKINKWNKSILKTRTHLIAHYMLAKALGGNMWFAYNNMNCHNVKLSSRLYEIGAKHMREQMSELRKNTVSAINLVTGEKYHVSKKEFDNNQNLVGVTKGMFTGDKNPAKNKSTGDKISKAKKGYINVIIKETSKMTSIHRDKFNEEIYEIPKNTALHNSLICVYDETNKIIQVENTNEKYLNGTYKHINIGRKKSKESIEKQKQSRKNKIYNYSKTIYYLVKDTIVLEFFGKKRTFRIL